jgi:hypothetical protein
MSARDESTCRLCSSRVPTEELHRGLCPICDEYAQHLALQTNQRLDKIVGEVQNGAVFRAASRTQH